MTSEELTAALGRGVVAVERRPFAYASSHPLELLDVWLTDGTVLPLVIKDTRTFVPPAQYAKPALLHDPERELEVYRKVLAGSNAPAPCLAATLGGRLLLEYIPGRPLTEVGEIGVWEHAARSAGRMHEQLRGRDASRLIRYDNAFFARWLDRARVFVGVAVDALRDAYLDSVERILSLPTTVIHGELYASNVLISGERVCVLDWETAGIAPGLIDLAALTSGAWTATDQKLLAAAYVQGLGDPVSESDLRADLERCRLILAIQLLGWSRTWSPPMAQRQDWLAEARRAAEAVA